MMYCAICRKDREEAHIRECELDVAAISGRAHVDCSGHSMYRAVSKEEVADELERRKEDEE